MALWDDERGQPVQIGFILIFAVLIVSFAVYQAVVVPQQNAQVEFSHYQQVGQDVTDLRNDLLDAVGSGDTRSASVTLGTTYPSRAFALNPAPPSGTLATTGAGAVNVTGLSKNATELCADPATTNGVESRSLVYRPAYNEYGAAEDVTYENTFVVRSFRDGARYGTQKLVEDAGGSGTNRVNLRLLTNEFEESGTGTASVDLEPSRTYEETFSLSTGESFSVIVPSQFSVDTWNTEILDGVDAVQSIKSVQPGGNRIEITLEPGDYTISCAAIGLNQQPAYQPPETTDEDIAYSTRWNTTAIESETGVSDCTAGVCTYDRNDDADNNLTLTALTDPTAVNATLDFALNTTDVGVLSTNQTETDTNGEGTTTLETDGTGGVTVYVASGGSGDTIEIKVIDSGGGGPPGGPP